MLLSRLLQVNWSDIQYTVDEFGRYVYSFPVHIRLVIAMTLVFLVIILLLLGVIMGSRIYKTRRANKKQELSKKYQPLFRQYLFDDDESRSTILSLVDPADLVNKFHRATLLEEIIHLHENFTGETAERLEEIYVRLGLQNDSLKKLESKRWYIVAKGMKELALMNLHSSYDEILKFLNSKNEILRMESRIALMKLSEKEPLAFLSKETAPLSDWDTANIYNMLTKMPESIIPDFSKWLGSENKDVVVFCVRMTGTYRQHGAVSRLTGLLKNGDERLKLAVIRALRELNASSAENALIAIFPEENNAVKSEILRTLQVSGSENSLPMLERIIRQPVEDYPISIQAVRSLISSGEKGKNIVDSVFRQAGPTLQLIIRHAKDKRL